MKNFILIAAVLCIPNLFYSQPWLDNLPKNKSNQGFTFKEYQKAFYDYWTPFKVVRGKYADLNGIERKATGWKQFKRWEWYMEAQVDRTTGEFPKTTAMYEFFKSQSNAKMLKASSYSWTNLGTGYSDGGYAGIGRINCIAFHPNDINTYWVGTPSGGVWKTSNNGVSWVCLTDNTGVLGVSSIIIPSDYATSNTIYIGTGDRDSFDNYSIGVLKSTDGGLTWSATNLSFQLYQRATVTKMLINPTNNSHILATTNVGVYETINGGTTFNKISSNAYVDFECMPGNFKRFYCSWRSAGRIDTLVLEGSVWMTGKAITVPNAKRIELAVCPTRPSWVYAVATNLDGGLQSIYKTENAGISFAQIFSGTSKNLLGYSPTGSDSDGQGWYDLSIVVSPTNANTLFVGGINTWKSTNGGLDWSIVNHWNGNAAQEVHADKHYFAFRSDGALFELNDGGVYISANNGSSGSWVDKTNGIVISQMYKLGVSQIKSNEVITGLQDNGSKLYSGGVWHDVKGGDGMECLIDYTNENIQYATYINGQISRTVDHWENDYTDIEPKDGEGNSLEGAWVTPYIIHPTDSRILFAGYKDVYKTNDRGNNWTRISYFNTPDNIRTMAICRIAPDVLYVADETSLWKTTNGGTSWESKSSNLPSSGNILSLTVKGDNPDLVWITLGGFQHDGIYESSDGGNSWISISGGLPQIPVYSIVCNEMEKSRVDLYAGTEVGVYYKEGNTDWLYYNNGLPNVLVSELEIFYDKTHPDRSKLRAATYGRGLWETQLSSTTTTIPIKPESESGITLFPNPTTDELNIKINELKKNMYVSIKDITGKSIYTNKIDRHLITLNLGKHAKGIYFIDIFGPGERTVSKLILE